MDYYIKEILRDADRLQTEMPYSSMKFYVCEVNGKPQRNVLRAGMDGNFAVYFGLKAGDILEIYSVFSKNSLTEFEFSGNVDNEVLKRMAHLKTLLLHSPFLENFKYGSNWS